MMRATIFCMLLICAESAALAESRLLSFTFTSDDHGEIGSFTVSEDNFLANIGGQLSGSYLSNNWIEDLNFLYAGLTWTISDVAIDDFTSFLMLPGELPDISGGSGYLANKPGFPGGTGGIVIFHSVVGTRFGTETLKGDWSTSIIEVPEPSSIWPMFAAMLGLVVAASCRRDRRRGSFAQATR